MVRSHLQWAWKQSDSQTTAGDTPYPGRDRQVRLADIFAQANWPETEACLRRHYCDGIGNRSDRDQFLSAHEYVYDQLHELQPEHVDTAIAIDFDNVAGVDDVHVYGVEPGSGDSLAIEFVRWERWLGMDVAPPTLQRFSPSEVVAHCLHEMTLVGYEQERIGELLVEVRLPG